MSKVTETLNELSGYLQLIFAFLVVLMAIFGFIVSGIKVFGIVMRQFQIHI